MSQIPAGDEELRRLMTHALWEAAYPRYILLGDGRIVPLGEPYYSVKEPPWWRPFARRRYRLGIKVLRDRTLEELTPPPS